MAKSIPFHLIQSLKQNPTSIEAILFGQLGFFEEENDDKYFNQLKEIYFKFKTEYAFIPNAIPLHFFRMRPNNFPTIRVSQLARFLASLESPLQWLLSPMED